MAYRYIYMDPDGHLRGPGILSGVAYVATLTSKEAKEWSAVDPDDRLYRLVPVKPRPKRKGGKRK